MVEMSVVTMSLFRLLPTAAAQRFPLSTPSLLQRVEGLHLTHKKEDSKPSFPDPPKRPLTPFFAFLEENRSAILSSIGRDAPLVEVSRVAGEKWRNCPEEEKGRYKERYEREVDGWKEKLAAFREGLEKKNLLGEFEAMAKEERLSRAVRRAKTSKKKMDEELGKPKRTPTALNLFVREQMSSSSSGDTSLREVVAMWKEMSEGERAKYVAQAERLKEEYNR